MKKGFIFLLILFVTFSTKQIHAEEIKPLFQNLNQIKKELNLTSYYGKRFRNAQKLKIAIFDNGFKGLEEVLGKKLPATTKYHAGPVVAPEPQETHGLYMAMLFYQLVTNEGANEEYAPSEFHLYNTFGYSNFKAAVEDAISQKIDLILYSQTWEYGGNNDGNGFINALVNQATDAGIFWINNTGNFGDTTYNSSINTLTDDWVDLAGQNNALELRCAENPTKKCNIRLVLSWNDFSDNVNEGSDKDLDFVLTDDTLNIIQGSSLIQSKNPKEERPGYTKYPREIITAEIKPGAYFVRVKNRSKNFTHKDRLRITASGDFVKMERFDNQESLLPPADNSSVITVGALDSEKSSFSVKLKKPELLTNSLVSLNKEENYKGSSNSAAMVAAGITILKTIEPDLSKEDILRRTSNRSNNDPTSEPGNGLPLSLLGFSYTGDGCFIPVDLGTTYIPQYVSNALAYGGTLVHTNAGQKIFYDFDPIVLMPHIARRYINDILVVSPYGPGIYNRSGLWNLPIGLTEVLETPKDESICGSFLPQPKVGFVFRLP